LVPILVASLTACSITPPNPDGWRDPGVHAVDGYWVTSERACVEGVDRGCKWMFDTAIATLLAREPDAQVVSAVAASYPRDPGPGKPKFSFAGLVTPRLVILDLADGSRRTIGLLCGALDHVDGEVIEGCRPASLDQFRVGNGRLADP
jgi:hypothetical protein